MMLLPYSHHIRGTCVGELSCENILDIHYAISYLSPLFPVEYRLLTTFLHCSQPSAMFLWLFHPYWHLWMKALLFQVLFILNYHWCFCNFDMFLVWVLALCKALSTSGKRYSMLLWPLSFDLFNSGGPTWSLHTAGINLSIMEVHKPPHCDEN